MKNRSNCARPGLWAAGAAWVFVAAGTAQSQENPAPPAAIPAAPALAAPVARPSLADQRLAGAANAPVLTLVDAIALALENNPQIATARASLAAAQARVGTARSAGGLQVGANGSVNYNKNYGVPSFGGGAAASSFTTTGVNESAGVAADLPIYTGGRVKASTKAADFAARAQAAQTLQVEQDLVLSTIDAYLNVLRSQQLLDVAESNLAVSREQLRVARVRFDAGAAARLDVLRANNVLAQAQQRRVAASDTLAQAKSTVNTLLNRAPETAFNTESITTLTPRTPLPAVLATGANGATPATNATSADLRTMAETARPAIAAADAQVQSAAANIDVAKSQRKPSLGLSLSSVVRNPVTILGRVAVALGLSVAQTLYDSGRAKSQIAEAQALTAQARGAAAGQRNLVANQIDQALFNLDSAQQRSNAVEAAVAEAQEALRAARLGFEAGARTALDVTDAQSALLTTQTDAVNARFDVAASQAQLAAAVGVNTAEGQAAYEKAMADETKRVQQTPQVVPVSNTSNKKRHKFLGIF